MNDEEIPYRSQVPSEVTETKKYSVDENDQSTLKSVYYQLKESVDNIDKWHAFNCSKDTDLKMKQHIHAHKLAFEIVNPLFEQVRDALAAVDATFKERNHL